MNLIVTDTLARQIGEEVMKGDPENLREGLLFGERDEDKKRLIVEGVRVPDQRPGCEGSEKIEKIRIEYIEKFMRPGKK